MLEPRWCLHGDQLDPSHPDAYELIADPVPGDTDTAAILASGLATYALTSVPVLNSLAGAAVSLYLNFVGHFDATWGGYQNITTPPFDQDGDTTTFSDGELATISNVWRAVAEDYAPFKVNVTTVEPPTFANGAALMVAIGGNGSWTGATYGGIAYVNSFTNSSPNTVFVFPKNLGNGYAKYVADASSHEAGHGFGLYHQSQYGPTGSKIAEYYTGPGDGTAPLMGNSYNAPRSLWWNGTSTSSTTNQDDMAVIARSKNGFGYRADDHGNTSATATALSVVGNQLSGSGIISTTSDLDYFSFSTGGGQLALSVDVAAYNNLDARIELREAGGALIASAAPANSFGATISATITAGSYRLVVAAGSGYGNVGQYSISGSIAEIPVAAAVLNRLLFYNNSKYDGYGPGVAAVDDQAIAIDKVAYLAGAGVATFANISSYSNGINGIMIDISGSHPSITASDFAFKIGNNDSPATWATAAPATISLRVGAGVGGSDRVELVWPDHAIENTWLEVTIAANANTGLAAPDVFYFGSAVGNSGLGDTSNYALVSSVDENGARSNPELLLNNISVTNLYDYNRDGSVSSIDQAIDRAYSTNPSNATRYIDLGAASATLGADAQLAVWNEILASNENTALAASPSSVPPKPFVFSRFALATDQAIGLLDSDDFLAAHLDSIGRDRYGTFAGKLSRAPGLKHFPCDESGGPLPFAAAKAISQKPHGPYQEQNR